MTRESDADCLSLIAEIRARMGESAGLATGHEIARLLGNLEARIRESGDMGHDSHCVREKGALRERKRGEE